MPESMIERVAREIRACTKPSPACLRGITESDAKIIARAVIQIMREPTRGMCFAADVPEHFAFSNDDAASVWRAMIDAALSPDSTPTPEPSHDA